MHAAGHEDCRWKYLRLCEYWMVSYGQYEVAPVIEQFHACLAYSVKLCLQIHAQSHSFDNPTRDRSWAELF